MTYEEVVTTINNIRRFGNLSGAEITAAVLEQLHHPEQGMKMIHIAGTNGKGSVSAFLCEILKEAGLKTGMFTSPHLVDFEERIRINGEMISKEDVTRIGGMLLEQNFTSQAGLGVHPTMFDYCLAMAVLYFKEQNCDVMVIETGLGGRLDSTNAIGTPEVTVITKIGYDHMAILGDTLPEIAAEKAGVIKKGTHLVVESQELKVLNVLLEAAENAGAASCEVVNPLEIEDKQFDGTKQSFSFRNYKKLSMQMLGTHQYENAAAAILAAEAYFTGRCGRPAIEKACTGAFGAPCKGAKEEVQQAQTGESVCSVQPEFTICSVQPESAICSVQPEAVIRSGIFRTRWQGRMEIIQTEPFLMLDGAHNSNGVEALAGSLTVLFPGEKFHFIMGVMADKDYEKMVERLFPLAIDFTTVTVESSQALQAKELAACIQKLGIPAECGELPSCLYSEEGHGREKTIAFGSLYFIGEIEALFNKRLQNDDKNP